MVTDAFTKWVEIQAIPDIVASTCAEHLVDAVISRFGSPQSLHSDQGHNYEIRIIAEINKTRTTPRRPQCNSQTERFNHTIIQMIKAYIKGEQKNWDRYLPCLAAAYRWARHETTGFSPNFLMLGREVRLPGDIAPTDPQSWSFKLSCRICRKATGASSPCTRGHKKTPKDCMRETPKLLQYKDSSPHIQNWWSSLVSKWILEGRGIT